MYEKILEAYRRETRNTALQPIEPDFYSKICQYTSELRELLNSPNISPLNRKLIEEEVRRVKSLAEDLVDLRFGKMVQEALEGSL
ncbi:MAG: hypothetical protein QW390_02655, partial [Candidatus Bathyarchaeia archaeon]